MASHTSSSQSAAKGATAVKSVAKKSATSRGAAASKAIASAPRRAAIKSRPVDSEIVLQTGLDIPLYYVGIGASAGGLEALRPFVANLPQHANMTYILAQHMSPDHRSLMVELLGRETSLKVVEAKNDTHPMADIIYIAPPNTDVTVVHGKLMIGKPTNTVGPKPSVDRFFISLADDQEDRAIGIILSGTGSDGARGIKAVKAAGGITIAQEPKSAKYDSMPVAAVRVGGADLVLPPHEIAAQLQAIVERPRAPFGGEPDETPPNTIREIVRQIAAHTGMDFTNYKDATIQRQIMRRMAALQIPGLDAYGMHIAKNRRELSDLASNFLICVTSFFRDRDSFEGLRRVMRDMLSTKKPGDDIRIWVPGCATGEEVYSLAIMLVDELGTERDKYRIQLFATDINNDAVATARAGIYPESALSELDSKLIERYFSAQDGMYRIDRSLRDMTLFARQDLVQDPPFVRLDMVSCRNLLIYFKSDLQERVMKIFHYSLRQNGVLFLGKSEAVGRLANLFSERDRKHKIFLKRAVASPIVEGFPRSRGITDGQGRDRNTARAAAATAAPASILGRERLFSLYAPASLLMSGSGDLLETFGDCSNFLSLRPGKADFNVFTLIKPDFRAELRAFTHRVSRTKESHTTSPVEITEAGKLKHFRMSVHYVGQSELDESDLYLVCFEPVESRGLLAKSEATTDRETQDLIAQLEHESVINRENLQSVIEELETANEELQSLNEEAQAGNEELQASNEELETANEELQASNEELITVNDELGVRTVELSEAINDLTNVLNSLYKALLVIDDNLFIVRYNKVALQFFDIPADGRANLANVATHFHCPRVLTVISEVLKTQAPGEFEFQHEDGRYFVLRAFPYLDSDHHKIKGVVVTILDITKETLAQEQLRLSASVFEHTSEGTMITDAANQIISVNPAFTTITGYSVEEVIGKNPSLLKSGQHSKEFYQRMWRDLLSKGTWTGEVVNRRKNGDLYTQSVSINTLKNEEGEIRRHIAVFRDITVSKVAQETIERQATYDALTGLPNRNLILDRLRLLLLRCRRDNRMLGVLFLDIDHFKLINDSMGHLAGDELLVKVSQRIRSALRESDSVGRLGGDEFIVLLSDLTGIEDVVRIANKVLWEVRQPLVVAGQTLQSSTSIGITMYPMDADNPETMLMNADGALYEAKRKGRNTFCFFTQSMQDATNRRHWIEVELGTAIEKRCLAVHYQPIVDLESMNVVGVEALMRWNHPASGFIPPEVFIPVAEQTGMISTLSKWVFETALKDWSQWRPESKVPMNLAFNLSAAQFVMQSHVADLLELVDGYMRTSGCFVTVEITESLKLVESTEYLDVLNKFRHIGCRIAIDDFGTGYSSISYLKRLPIDVVKIDKSFVRDITSNPSGAATVRAILQMAIALDLKVVAEGVETKEQLDFLRQHGCHFAQGFLFSKPAPLADLKPLLNNWTGAF
ncbi:MAG: EAL domain-containing protein [Comamonadaceae bacterium]